MERSEIRDSGDALKTPDCAALHPGYWSGFPPLFQRRVDRGEFGVELRADALDGGDDRKGDAAGDQAIFDRGGAGFVAQEFCKQPHTGLPIAGHGFFRVDAGPTLRSIGCEEVDQHAEQSIKTDAET